MHTLQLKSPGAIAVSHDTIVCPNDTSKKAKADDALAVFVFQALIIDQGNIIFNHGLHESTVIGLHFLGMRKEHITLVGNQHAHGHFLNPQEQITVGQVIGEFNPRAGIFLVGIATIGRMLHFNFHILHVFHQPFTLRRRKGNAGIGRLLPFFNKTNDQHSLKISTNVQQPAEPAHDIYHFRKQ